MMTRSRLRAIADRANAKWSQRDERNALAAGWGLFAVDSGGTVIQKMDEPAIHPLWKESFPEECPFDSDSAARRYVRKLAKGGDKTALKAVAIHDRHIAAWNRWRRLHIS